MKQPEYGGCESLSLINLINSINLNLITCNCFVSANKELYYKIGIIMI